MTGAARTVVDLGRTDRFVSALAAADHALREGLVTRDALLEAYVRHPGREGRRRAEQVLAAADPASESVGESLSRGRMIELGLQVPRLQEDIYDADGLVGRADFLWPEERVVGEFDGRAKYQRPEMLAGREPGDVVWHEKLREDRLRAAGFQVVRWTWTTAMDPRAFGALLRRAGVGTGP